MAPPKYAPWHYFLPAAALAVYLGYTLVNDAFAPIMAAWGLVALYLFVRGTQAVMHRPEPPT